MEPVRFDYFLGVDQTGALLGKKPKPLQAALIKFSYDSVVLSPLELESLSHQSFESLAKAQMLEPHRTALVTDGALGLPTRVLGRRRVLWKCIQSTHKVSGNSSRVAKAYFEKLFDHEVIAPRRYVEEIHGLNSLFHKGPFQRTQQAATFRMWRDLSENSSEPWFNLWPYDLPSESPDKPWLFEGQPLLFWKLLFGQHRREPKVLPEIVDRLRIRLSRADYSLARKDPDVADAYILALGAFVLLNRPGLPLVPRHPRIFAREGWILGA